MNRRAEVQDVKDKPRLMAEKRLLVVDDEPVVCQVVEGFLSHAGWEVDFTFDTETAFHKHEQHPFPVVLLDVHMPGDSSALLERIKRMTPLSQVIMFTGDPSVASARDAVKLGAYDYILKPLQREALVHEVSQAFDTHNLLAERESLRLENEDYRNQLEEKLEARSGQLRESELRYRAVFDRSTDAIFLVDAKTGEIADYNFAARRLIGVEANELKGRPIDDFVRGQLALCFHEAKQDGHREWHLQRVSFRRGEHETRMTKVAVTKSSPGEGSYLQIVARDITDIIEIQDRAERLELELIAEQRLANIGLLASGVAHNLNTPLMGIYGLAQVLKMNHPDLHDLDGILAQVERINGIIRNLMWKSRQESQQTTQEINLNQLLQEELKFLEADLDFKHNVEKDVELGDEVPPIMGKYSDFSQSIMNIVRNSLDAMHDREEKRLSVSTRSDGEYIIIEVRDSGCGIDKENREKIFKPFFSTKPPTGTTNKAEEPTGAGLGLSTVQKLMSAYGCKFEIDSEAGKGTSFQILIPIAPNAVERETA